MRVCVRPLTLSNMNISATSWLIGIKFYLKHHWGGGKASVGFDPDRFPWQQIAPIYIELQWEKRCHHVFSNAFDRIVFILAGNDDMHESLDEFEIWPDSTTDFGVSCP